MNHLWAFCSKPHQYSQFIYHFHCRWHATSKIRSLNVCGVSLVLSLTLGSLPLGKTSCHEVDGFMERPTGVSVSMSQQGAEPAAARRGSWG